MLFPYEIVSCMFCSFVYTNKEIRDIIIKKGLSNEADKQLV